MGVAEPGRALCHQAVGKCGKTGIPFSARGVNVSPRDDCESRLFQAVLAIQWLWSLSMLWVAATNRNSECTAALPLRMN